VAVQGSQRAQRVPVVIGLAGRGAVLGPVVLLGVAPERQDDLVDGQAIRCGRRGQAPAIPQPLGDEAVVLSSAVGGAVLPEVLVFAVDPHDGLAARPVEAVGRGPLVGLTHGAASSVDYGEEFPSGLHHSPRMGTLN
jgi:hypothetical protein